MHENYVGLLIIFLVIGASTYFTGCNPDYDTQCFGYNVVHGTAYAYNFDTDTCKECIKEYDGSCLKYRKYACYSAYVKFHFDGNHTCFYATRKDSKSEASALDSVKSHPIGEKMALLEREGSSSTCLKLHTAMNTWIAGVAFLSLAALVGLAWLCEVVWIWAKEIISVHYAVVPKASETELAPV